MINNGVINLQSHQNLILYSRLRSDIINIIITRQYRVCHRVEKKNTRRSTHASLLKQKTLFVYQFNLSRSTKT